MLLSKTTQTVALLTKSACPHIQGRCTRSAAIIDPPASMERRHVQALAQARCGDTLLDRGERRNGPGRSVAKPKRQDHCSVRGRRHRRVLGRLFADHLSTL